MNKKTFLVYLFFILIYGNQGFSGLPGQCIYYLSRESWGLSATALGWMGFVTGFAWYIKPLLGLMMDQLPIRGYRNKNYMIMCYIGILVGCIYVIAFGLTLTSLLVLGFLMNMCVATADVANDTQMCILEKKHNLKGKIQAIQWGSLGIMGLLVSIFGAMIATKLPEPLNYKLAYGLTMIMPICILIYLTKFYEEEKIKIKPKLKDLKKDLKFFKEKHFYMGLLFIAFMNFSPSFGTSLMIQMREVLHIDKMFLGYLSATGTVLGLIGYILYYFKAHKYPIKNLLYFTIIFGALTNLFYLYLPNKWVILSYSVLFGAFSGISFLAVLAYIARIVPKGAEGLFYAFVVSINNFSAQLGDVFGGYIYDHLGYTWNVLISTGFTLCCLFFIPHLGVEEEVGGK